MIQPRVVLAGMFLLAVFGVQFTLPSMDARPGSCDPDTIPVRGLNRVELWGQTATVDSALLGTHSAAGRAGQRDSFTVALEGRWDLWAVTLDSSLNRSCRSNILAVGPGASVDPPGPPGPGPVHPPVGGGCRGPF
jgi:hypothetical protein